MLGMLNSDKLDIVIGRTSVSQNAGNYDYVHLAEEDVSIVAGNGNPLTQQKKLALSDLKDARWLAYPHRAPLNILLKQELERADINTFTAPVETARSEERRVGKEVSERVDIGGRRISKKKQIDK